MMNSEAIDRMAEITEKHIEDLCFKAEKARWIVGEEKALNALIKDLKDLSKHYKETRDLSKYL